MKDARNKMKMLFMLSLDVKLLKDFGNSLRFGNL